MSKSTRPHNRIAEAVARENPDLVWYARGKRHYLISQASLDAVGYPSEDFLHHAADLVQEGSKVVKNRYGGTGR